jgi:tight adherence protein C
MLPILEQNPGYVAAVAAAAFVFAGTCFLVYDFLLSRDSVARRITRLLPSRAEIDAKARAQLTRPEARRSLLGSLPKGTEQQIGWVLKRLGIAPRHSEAAYGILRLLSATLLALAMGALAGHFGLPLAGMRSFGLIAIGGVAGWLLPRLFLHVAGVRYRQAVERGLPDAIELLVVSVEAGLSLEDGIDRIVGELHRAQPELAQELILTAADLKILPSRDQALENFAERMDLPSVRSVVTTLSQTMRYGTPLTQALRVVAAELRNESIVKLEERANQLPNLMTVPMIVFILPAIFLIVGGPAFLRLIDIFLR